MSNSIRSILLKTILQCLESEKNVNFSAISSNIRLSYEQSNQKFTYTLPLLSDYHNLNQFEDRLINAITSNNFVTKVSNSYSSFTSKLLHFEIDNNVFTKQVLDTSSLKACPPLYLFQDNPKQVIVEFSSPNIAKPFHVGHLRSTILGNFVANINEFMGNKVIRINYLGDWGTQFGFVELGIKLANISKETIEKDPIKTLFNAYVHANKLAENDPAILEQARAIFHKLETGDKGSFTDWDSYKKYTIQELASTYNRLGITFDAYEWESMYSMGKIGHVISDLERLNSLSTDELNRKVVKLNIKDEEKIVPLVKSDGTSLYLTRDLAAAIDRHKKYNFDKMFYVVDNSQIFHFENLIAILNDMNLPWTNKLEHLPFGKIMGMSTRKGTAVFLKDMIEEVRSIARKAQEEALTTKVDLSIDDGSAEILGLSAIIVNDFRYRRRQNYWFEWKQILDLKKKTGVRLQYVHCRLSNLEENCGNILPQNCDPSVLKEPIAQELVYMLEKFDEVIIESYIKLEPKILTDYLFALCHVVNIAFKHLRIKGETEAVAAQRLLLMHKTKLILGKSMKLLGLKPLKKM